MRLKDINTEIKRFMEINRIKVESKYSKYEMEMKWKWIKNAYRHVKICKWYFGSIGEVACRYAALRAGHIGSVLDKYVFVPYGKVCNMELFKMISENLCVINSNNYEFWKYIILNHYTELDFSEYDILEYRRSLTNVHCQNSDVFLKFCSEKQKEGERMLQIMGIVGEYVCFFSRSGRYREKVWGKKDFKEYVFRNGKFENYKESILYLKDKGIQAVRVGKYPEEVEESKDWIDFSKRYDDFLDLFLLAHCKFFVGDVSGIGEVPKLFGKPILYINMTNFSLTYGGHTQRENNLVIRKKMYHTRLNKYLSLKQIVNYESRYGFDGSLFLQNGIIAEENTEKEICDAVKEMYERIMGLWVNKEEDEILQKKYLDITAKYEINNRCIAGGSYVCRMGNDYLKENIYLIE